MGQPQAEVHQRVDVAAAVLRTKDDQQGGLGAQGLAELLRFVSQLRAGEGRILAGKEAHDVGIAILRNDQDSCACRSSLMPAWFTM